MTQLPLLVTFYDQQGGRVKSHMAEIGKGRSPSPATPRGGWSPVLPRFVYTILWFAIVKYLHEVVWGKTPMRGKMFTPFNTCTFILPVQAEGHLSIMLELLY